MTDHETRQKVIDSLHTREGMYCVDVVRTEEGFSLQTCRRDEERWFVIEQLGTFDTRDRAVAAARAAISTLES